MKESRFIKSKLYLLPRSRIETGKPSWNNSEIQVYEVEESQFIKQNPIYFPRSRIEIVKPSWKNSETQVFEVNESQFIKSKPYLLASFKNRDSETLIKE